MPAVPTPPHALFVLLAGTAILLVLSFVLRPAWRRLCWAGALFLAVSDLLELRLHLAAALDTPPDSGVVLVLERAFGIVWWLALAQTVIEALEVFLWAGLFARGGVRRAPKLLTQLVAVLVYTAAGFSILSYIFEQSLTGLLATSGIVAVVLGFALQTTLADVFTGIALNLERPFRVGDWIRVDRDTLGEVVEHNWRATRIRTRDGNHMILPNSALGKATLTNYNYPDDRYAIVVSIGLGYDLPPERACRALLAAALSCENVLTEPAPAAVVAEFGDSAIRYLVKCWLRDYSKEPLRRSEIAQHIWHYLQRSGIQIPFPHHDVRLLPPEPPEAREPSEAEALIAAIEVFAPFSERQRSALATAARRRSFAKGEHLVTQGEAGSSLFVIAEGLCYVVVGGQGDGRHVVARLRPGEFFGEMSLLTGEPRSATVLGATDGIVYEMEKETLAPLLAEAPEVAEGLGRVLAGRKLATEGFRGRRASAVSEAELRSQSEQFLWRIRLFFGLR
jgi:branched-chain amino acid transport system substrate-binding protein